MVSCIAGVEFWSPQVRFSAQVMVEESQQASGASIRQRQMDDEGTDLGILGCTSNVAGYRGSSLCAVNAKVDRL